MPLFCEVCKVVVSKFTKQHSDPFQPYNDLTAKLAEIQAKEDMKKEKEQEKKKEKKS
jgi:hypothetical protein